MTDEIEGLDLPDKVVLLSVAALSLADETPAHTGRVVRACTEQLARVDVETIGTPSEAEVNRALNRLEARGIVENVDDGDDSPVGKGRPTYALEPDTPGVLEALASDDDVAPIARLIAQES